MTILISFFPCLLATPKSFVFFSFPNSWELALHFCPRLALRTQTRVSLLHALLITFWGRYFFTNSSSKRKAHAVRGRFCNACASRKTDVFTDVFLHTLSALAVTVVAARPAPHPTLLVVGEMPGWAHEATVRCDYIMRGVLAPRKVNAA